jgi:integrase
VQNLRTAFGWLQDVRYLGGNPWVAVADPRTDQQIHAMQIERALPLDFYEKTLALLSDKCEAVEASQARISLVTLLLLGDCGLRISEAAGRTLSNLAPSDFTPGRYQLKVRGKRSKWRIVPLSPRALATIRSHQADVQQRYLNLPQSKGHALIRPITLPRSQAIRSLDEEDGKGYAPNALARVLTKALKAIAGLEAVTVDEVIRLKTDQHTACVIPMARLRLRATCLWTSYKQTWVPHRPAPRRSTSDLPHAELLLRLKSCCRCTASKT